MFLDGKIYMPCKTKVIINICNMDGIQITIMEYKKIVKKSVSTHYEEMSWIESQQCTTVNEVSDQNTSESVLCKCVEKLRDLSNCRTLRKCFVFVVAVIEFLKGCG